MVNFLVLVLFLMSYIPMAAIAFLLLEQSLAFTLMGIIFVGWGITYIYFDKIILALIKAREVFNTDAQDLFQIIKNNSYKFHETSPKVYLYDSSMESFFIFESRGQWCLVLSRKLLKLLDDEKKESLVELAFRYKKSHMTKIKTKCLGLSILYKIIIHKLASYLYPMMTLFVVAFAMSFARTWMFKIIMGVFIWGIFILLRYLWTRFFLLSKKEDFNKGLYKSFYLFLSLLIKPFFIPVEFLLHRPNKVMTHSSLKPFYLTSKEKVEMKDRMITNLVVSDERFDKLIVDYIENFPLFLECEFKNEF